MCGLAREAPNRKMCHIFPRCVHIYTELIHGWQYMAVTLAPIAPDIPHYGMYKHTGGACMPHKDPAPPIRLRSRMRLNILWPSERPQEQPRVSCRSVHMHEPNGSPLPVQMAGGMGAVMGPSAQSGFELKNTHLVWLRRLRWPCSQRHSLDTRCTWRKLPWRRGSRMEATRKKSRANSARHSAPCHRERRRVRAASMQQRWGCHCAFRRRLPGGRGEKARCGSGSKPRTGIKGPQCTCW